MTAIPYRCPVIRGGEASCSRDLDGGEGKMSHLLEDFGFCGTGTPSGGSCVAACAPVVRVYPRLSAQISGKPRLFRHAGPQQRRMRDESESHGGPSLWRQNSMPARTPATGPRPKSGSATAFSGPRSSLRLSPPAKPKRSRRQSKAKAASYTADSIPALRKEREGLIG